MLNNDNAFIVIISVSEDHSTIEIGFKHKIDLKLSEEQSFEIIKLILQETQELIENGKPIKISIN